MPHLKEVKFFRDIPHESFPNIAKSLTYMQLPAQSIVFEYGTIGDLFYIILKGSVTVMVPDKKKIAKLEKGQNAAPVDKSMNKPPIGGDEEEADKVDRLPVGNSKPRGGNRRRSTLMKGFVNTLGNSAIHNLLDEPIFEAVGRMGAGKSFGELALQKRRPRAARIICETNCEFACMSKSDYDKILNVILQKLAREMMEFTQSIPLFSSWSVTLIRNLFYFMEKKNYIKGQAVIQEGDPITEVCIIRSGEFEVSSRIKEKKEFHLELTEKLQGKNYMQKFLKPK